MAKGKKSKPDAEEAKNSPTIENRRSRFDYHITDTIEAGMILRGSEVKSIRAGKASLAEGFVRVEFGSLSAGHPKAEQGGGVVGAGAKTKKTTKVVRRTYEPGAYLHNVNIAEYPPAGPSGSAGQHKPTRTRVLLVHQRELARMAKEVETKGNALVPLKIYFKNGKAKLLIGIGRSKSYGDKRQTIAKREVQRDIARAMSKRV
jgi:SsrA-binding protein